MLVGGALGPALLHDPASAVLARHVLSTAVGDRGRPIRPLSPDTITLLLDGTRHDAVAVFGPEPPERAGQPLRVALPPGGYTDLWSTTDHSVGLDGELKLLAPDGIAVLVPR